MIYIQFVQQISWKCSPLLTKKVKDEFRREALNS